MNFDACGANTAVLENALSNAERKLSEVELCGYSGKHIFREFGGNNQRKYLSKSDNIS
jgi:hypothetical protein